MNTFFYMTLTGCDCKLLISSNRTYKRTSNSSSCYLPRTSLMIQDMMLFQIFFLIVTERGFNHLLALCLTRSLRVRVHHLPQGITFEKLALDIAFLQLNISFSANELVLHFPVFYMQCCLFTLFYSSNDGMSNFKQLAHLDLAMSHPRVHQLSYPAAVSPSNQPFVYTLYIMLLHRILGIGYLCIALDIPRCVFSFYANACTSYQWSSQGLSLNCVYTYLVIVHSSLYETVSEAVALFC